MVSTNRKIERAKNGPGLFEITLGIVMSLALGVALASLHLIFKPVEVVDKQPEAPEPGRVYFVEGSSAGGKAKQWTRKRQLLAEGAPADIVFSEEELNAWFASATQPAKTPKKKGEPEPESATQFYVPEKVNFRIADGVLQMGVVGKFSVFGWEQPLVVHTRGTFEPGVNGYVFKADQLFVGSLPTHVVPNLAPWLIKRVFAAQQFPEDLTSTWQRLQQVSVEGSSLRLVVR